MGNTPSNINNYKTNLFEGIPLLNKWIQNYQPEGDQKEYFNELQKKLEIIQQEKNYSKELYEDIRYLLKQFDETLPLQIKRKFEIVTLDNYTIFIASRHFETIEDHINLIQVSRRLKQNITKFHYNPFPLNEITREYFTHLQTLFIYNQTDNQFEEDKRIIKREIQMYPYYFEYHQKIQLEQWTNKKCSEIIFDSDKDNWSVDKSIFDDKIKGKKQLIFLIEDIDNEMFGYYLDTEITNDYGFPGIKTNSNSFHFNLQSKDNRLKQPMQFKTNDSTVNSIDNKLNNFRGYCLYPKSEIGLITIGDIFIYKEHYKSLSLIIQSKDFDYHGIENALCGKKENNTQYDYFTPKRFIVIQMK